MRKCKIDPIISPKEQKLSRQVKNLRYVFEPKNVAIIGASRNPSKIGNAILRNFLKGGFSGDIYAINPKAVEILGQTAYPKVTDVDGKIDCSIISIPSKYVYDALEESHSAGAKSAVVISGGFSEVGNRDEELRIKKFADDNDMAVIGPNCMGVLNPSKKVDSVFLPLHKMNRPPVGNVSFISQSGAVGGCVVDLSGSSGVGMAKFVSYGNGTIINETDLINYLSQDEQTKSIISYVEGVKDGRAFMRAVSNFTKNKPLVCLKAGKSALGAQAASSHTGSMAGSSKVFSSALEQSGGMEASTLDELFDLAKVFDIIPPKGPRVAVITNGGGNGVLATDAIESYGLELAKMGKDTEKKLGLILPKTTHAAIPLDLIGDADSDRYEQALQILAEDENIDVFLVIVLMQTAALDSRIVDVLMKFAHKSKKPLAVVSTGGDYTQLHCRILDSYSIPTYSCPDSAIRALSKIYRYQKHKEIKKE